MHKGSYNQVTLLGRLGSDPELKFTTAGTAVANVSIATNESWKDSSGDIKEKTEWHRVVIFGKRAETAGEWFKKGQLILIEGKLQTRSWEDKENVKRYTTEVICENFVMLGKKSDNGGSAKASEKNDSDELPF